MRSRWMFLSTLIAMCCGLLVTVTVFPPFVWAQDENHAPFVSNVHAAQRSGIKLVDISYDVDDPDGDLLTITVSVSDDGGSTFTVPAGTFTGDVGGGIVPDTGKQIVWDAGADVPEVYGTNYLIKITASDGPAGGQIIIGQDGTPMALVPAGEFEMGDSLDGMSDALPVHTVYVDAFYIDIYEVTSAQYKKFMDATGHSAPSYWNDSRFNGTDQPVVSVTWHDATAYAQWAGKRLPTEAEWEKAARGGLLGKRYPWGDEISHNDANYSGTGGTDVWSSASPVSSFAPNGYGLYDMAGNVWEWCADWYSNTYYGNSPYNNPLGPDSGSRRVLRGGSWSNSSSYLSAANRNPHTPTSTYDYVGFRCVSQD